MERIALASRGHHTFVNWLPVAITDGPETLPYVLRRLALSNLCISLEHESQTTGLWTCLPSCIETVDLQHCSGDFLIAADLREALLGSSWPALRRFRIQHSDNQTFRRDAAIYKRGVLPPDEAYEWWNLYITKLYGTEEEHGLDDFDDADFVWPAEEVVSHIMLGYAQPPSHYYYHVDLAIDDIGVLLAKRDIDVGSDCTYFFWLPPYRCIVKPKLGKLRPLLEFKVRVPIYRGRCIHFYWRRIV